ncbi:MAG: hypothetical protein J5661_07095 [Bacteroidaceae bacterium]|nr:hypothetical protein [Bacteroidaceae bacterium]
MRRVAVLLSFAILSSVIMSAQAQIWDRMFVDEYKIDSIDTKALKVELNALTFFRDNEYDSNITRGYSLPGTWLQPKLTYNPIAPIHLELGLHGLILDGANKYPNYAYHDIATWKDNQYTSGAHLLPWFRAQADLRHLTFVLGNIYGAQNHRLIDPLFNPEQNISADPEMGIQILLDRPHVHLDTWLNWQSYIYELDTHQEAFTVGVNSHLKWNKKENRFHWSSSIQLLIQHRGGEQDVTALGVQTLCNASAGIRMDYTPADNHLLTCLSTEVNLLGSYQQSGHLWPFDTGFATHVGVAASLWDKLGMRIGYFDAPKQYANLYGSPFMSTISLKRENLTFNGLHTAYLRVDYTHTFTKAYKLGAELEAFSAHSHGENDLCFSFGIYLRVDPSILIKRW